MSGPAAGRGGGHTAIELAAIAARALLTPTDPDSLLSRDPEVLAALAPLLERVLTWYYRLEVDGFEHVPDGKALIVINHNSGITFAEMLGFGARYVRERGVEDAVHGLGHDLIMSVPWLGNFLARAGGVRASHRQGDRVLEANRKILVAPGGNLEAFRPFSRRHCIDFGGHTGFIRLALRHQAPLLPVVFIGGHEGFFVLHDGRALARRLGLKRAFRLDTLPLFLGLPWGVGIGPLFHIPLPAKCRVSILPPISLTGYPPEAENDAEAVGALYRQITGAMQRELTRLASLRRFPILG